MIAQLQSYHLLSDMNKFTQLELDYRAYNKNMRRNNMHECQLDTLDDYRRYLNGTLKHDQEFKELEQKDEGYRRTSKVKVSSYVETKREKENSTAKREPLKYTGSLIKGISTLHKSNAVPVINEQEMIDHANMRR